MTYENVQQQLNIHRRTLANLETQIAAHGELNAPPAMLNQRVITKEKITELQAQLDKPMHAYFARILSEFDRYEDTTNIVFPALKPGTQKEKKVAQREEKRLRIFLSRFDPKYSPHNPDTLKPNEEAEEEELETFLLKNIRVALLGDPGAGKSTALGGLFRKYVERWEQGYSQIVPLFVTLNRWEEDLIHLVELLRKEADLLKLKQSELIWKEADLLKLNQNKKLEEEEANIKIDSEFRQKEMKEHALITSELIQKENEACRASLLEFLQREAREQAQNLPNLLKEGHILLLMDGLNELPGLKRNGLEIDDPRSTAIAELCKEYPKVLCLLSCRVKEFAKGPKWSDLHVLPLGREQVEAIARAYFENDTEIATRLIANLYDGKRKKLQTLAEKPFYLKRLLLYFKITSEIPENPAKLLHHSVEWAIEEEINKRLLTAKEGIELKERLSMLAFNMTTANAININMEQASVWLFQLGKPNQASISGKKLQANMSERTQSEIWLKYGEGVGLITLQNGDIRFIHQLLQEYFCAQFLQKEGFSKKSLELTRNLIFSEAWALWGILETTLVENLITIFKEEKHDPYLCQNARNALGWIGIPTIQPLILALNDEENNLNYNITEVLINIGAPSVEPLISALKDKNSNVRLNTIYVLGKLKDYRAIEPLINEINDKDARIRRFVAKALGEIGDAKAIETLTKAFTDEYSNVRSNIAEAFGNIGDTRAVKLLILALKDINADVRRSAAVALGKIGDPLALPELKNLAQSDNNLTSWGASVSKAALVAIDEIQWRHVK